MIFDRKRQTGCRSEPAYHRGILIIDAARKRAARSQAWIPQLFSTLENVVDRLCDTICSLNNEIISSITGRELIFVV